ncbi:MAG: TetR/AcrR family transcriptional regulator [Dongiaceae bacterium]
MSVSQQPSQARAPAPGRPKDPAKRQAILAAAQRLFLEKGLAAVSVDVIARAAGVSKLTVYSHFADKDDLFGQAVAEKCSEHLPAETFAAAATMPLRKALSAIGRGFVDLVFSDAALQLQRLIAMEAPRYPRIGELFWNAGPKRVCDDFVRFLRDRIAAGDVAAMDEQQVAGHFFAMLKGLPHMHALIMPTARPTPGELDRHVAAVVDAFLRAWGAPKGSRRPKASRKT